MARFFSQHPNPWGWNPTQYGGLPTQFTYLPGLTYLAAGAMRLFPSVATEHVYRTVASTLACLGPAVLFLFAFYFTRSRGWAAATALAYTFFSPCYGLIHTISRDRGYVYLPWRLQVLVKYGEGPHNAGLTLMPLALMASWAAAVGTRYWRIFAAAVLLAAITLTNWVAALALAFCGLTLLLTLAGSRAETGFRVWRLAACAALGYGLACFWLTPGFVRTIAFNWPADAFNYRLQQQQSLLLWSLAGGLLLVRYGFHRWWPFQRYLCWMTLTFFGFAWIVVWFYSYGIAVIPEARRYALEFELFLFLAVFEYFRLLARSPNPSIRLCAYGPAGMMILAGWSQPWRYATQGFAARTPLPREETIEYRLARRLADWQPRGRVYASGGLRFRLNSWFDFPQVGGGFESGLSDRMTFALAFQIRTGVNSEPGQEARDALEELKVLGVEYLVIHGPRSREHYRDFKNPRLMEGLLEAAHREEDDTIYRVPFQSLAHLVEQDELVAWPPSSRLPAMARYVAAIEDPLRPKLAATWLDSSRLRIEGPVPAGKLISVQVRNDPGWTASQDGRPVAIETDRVGYCVLRPEPSPRARIDLRYGGTREQKVMSILSAVVWIGALAGLAVKRGAR